LALLAAMFPTAKDSAAQRLALSSLLWLVVGILAGLTLAVYYTAPAAWDGLPLPLQRALEFGKVRMIHVDVLLFDWLSMAMVAAALYIVPRLCRTGLYSERLAHVLFWVWNLHAVLSVLTLDMGMNRGREYAEQIWPLDALFLAALGVTAVLVFGTVARRRQRWLYVSLWYFMGAAVWMPLLVIIGKGLWSFTANPYYGFLDNVANWFLGHVILGLWFTAIGLGVSYYLIPRLTGRPIYSHWLSLIGFWTLAFFYSPIGGHHTEWGPIPYWLQTEASVFSMLMFIPVGAAVWNLLQTMAQAPRRVLESPELAFLAVGLSAYALASAQGSLQALRTFNGYEHFSLWVPGHAMLALALGFGSIANAAVYYFVPLVARRALWSRPAAWVHFALWTVGFSLLVWLMQSAGLIQSADWRGGVVDWMTSTVHPARPYLAGVAGSGGLVLVGVAVFLWNIRRTVVAGRPVAAAAALPSLPGGPWAALPVAGRGPTPAARRPSRPTGVRVEGSAWVLSAFALLLFGFAVVSTVLVPALAAGQYAPSPTAHPYTPLQAEGRALYIEEGCWECHSQNVRTIEGGIGAIHQLGDIGPTSVPGDYVYQNPVLFGQHRRGPDLAHVAARWPSSSWQVIHLLDPQALNPGTWMPSFRYLSPQELQALAAYLETLQ
jgi:cbb3-type cytochrome c oxidase subunit I